MPDTVADGPARCSRRLRQVGAVHESVEVGMLVLQVVEQLGHVRGHAGDRNASSYVCSIRAFDDRWPTRVVGAYDDVRALIRSDLGVVAVVRRQLTRRISG